MPHFHTNSPTVAGSVLLCSNTHSLFGNLGQMCLCSNCSPCLWMPPVLWQPSPALTPRGPPRPRVGVFKPSQTLWASRFLVGGRRAQFCFPGRLGAPRPPWPAEYFAPFALSDQEPIASKTWWLLPVAMFTSVARACWKSISFVPSVTISNEGGDAGWSLGEESRPQLRQTRPRWAAVGLRET